MKYAPLMLANLLRKKTRLILTIGSFTVALFLFGLLAAVRGSFNQGLDIAGVDRLVVVNRGSIIQPLPLSYKERMLRVPGVKQVTHDNWFGGVYQDERNFIPQFVIDPENQRQMFPEFIVPDDQWQAFLKDRTGAIAGAQTAKRFGWKIGDRIPIKGTISPGSWEFNLDGIYHGSRPEDDDTQFWFQWDYFEERVPERLKGLVGWYYVRIDSPDNAPAIAKAIDQEFANSPYETRTQTEKAFAAGWVKQMGNVQLLILTIGSVVFFTLLLVTGNTMAIAVRERTAELAVLKAVGYSDRFALALIVGESLILALFGGVLGLVLAKVLTPVVAIFLRGMLPYFYLPFTAMLIGLGVALAVGALSGLLPAIGAMRLRVVDALRRV